MTVVPAVTDTERPPNPYATDLDIYDADGHQLVTIRQALDLAGIRPKASCVGWELARLLPPPAGVIGGTHLWRRHDVAPLTLL